MVRDRAMSHNHAHSLVGSNNRNSATCWTVNGVSCSNAFFHEALESPQYCSSGAGMLIHVYLFQFVGPLVNFNGMITSY